MTKTIAIIDDDEIMLEIYKEKLSDLGTVKTFTSVSEARRQIRDADVIILDFYLPDDPELIQETVPELKNIAPVILCSGVEDERVPTISFELGVSDYWFKTDDYAILRGKVKKFL
ncbi:MAG: response regulator [Rhodospirillales bacterium]|nr:response regulator [Rhodospirillales bacterium]MCW8861045.1 response regulator [Rhodospirillales bacterium]MCW8951353.1 response regulator [Rhodospirillales bacterium]MCW9038859.1 response regulator [Rhodospirillales bacterium]